MARFIVREEVLNVVLSQLLEERELLSVPETVRRMSASVNTSKPAIYRQGKTGHFADATETVEYYFGSPSVRKGVRTLVRQLWGPHLSTCA